MPVPWPESAEIKLYTGGCHCKKVRFEFEHPDIYTMPVMSCNCSICEERGYLTVSVFVLGGAAADAYNSILQQANLKSPEE
jgi:hypothetical protein